MTVLASAARTATWRERSATLAVFLGLGIWIGVWAAAVPVLKTRLSLTDSELSLALLAVASGAVVSTIAAGALVPRIGTGRAMAAAGLATVAAMALPALAGSLAQFVICALVLGLSIGAIDIAANGHASDVEQRWGAPIMSSFHAAFSAGGLIGSAVSGALAGAGFGLAEQMWVPLAATLPLVLLAVPALGPGARDPAGGGVSLALPERAAAGLCVTVAFIFMVEGAMIDWSGVYLSTVTGASTAGAAAGYAAFSLAMAGGRGVGDIVVRALGPRRVVVWGGLLAATGIALAVVVPRPGVAAVGFALVGIGAANVVPVVFSAAGRFKSSPSAGVAMVATVGYVGFIGGPPLIGGVATVLGLRGALALLVAASLLVALGGLDRALRRVG